MRDRRIPRHAPNAQRRHPDRRSARHGGPARPQGAGRRRHPRGAGGRARARVPPAGDPGRRPRRRPADDQPVRPLERRLQRRDLQFPGASARTGRGRRRRRRRRLAGPLGHGGAAGRGRPLGARGCARPVRRHVRGRALGPADPHAPPRARPDGREAALLRLGRAGLPVRQRAQGHRRASRFRRPPGSGGGRGLRALRLCAGAALDLCRDREALAGRDPRRRGGCRARRGDTGAVLGPDRRGRGRDAVRRRRRGGGRPAGEAAEALRLAAAGRGRAARGFPVRRHRQRRGDRHRPGGLARAGAHLRGRLQGPALRRGPVRQGRGPASGDRAHGGLCRSVRRAGVCTAPAGDLRRTLRGCLRPADDAAGGDDAPARDHGAQRRRRRRAVLRLSALCRHAQALARRRARLAEDVEAGAVRPAERDLLGRRQAGALRGQALSPAERPRGAVAGGAVRRVHGALARRRQTGRRPVGELLRARRAPARSRRRHAASDGRGRPDLSARRSPG